MPAKTARQARFMRMCAHNPSAAYKACPSKSVAIEFMSMKKRSKKKKRY